MGIMKSLRQVLSGKPAIETELEAAEAELRSWQEKRASLVPELEAAEASSAADRAKALANKDLDEAQRLRIFPEGVRLKMELADTIIDQEQAKVQRIRDRLAEVAAAQAWVDLDAKLKDRQAALAKVVKQADSLAAAMLEAQAIDKEAFELLPVKVLSSGAAVDYRLQPKFSVLEGEVGLLLAFASDGKIGSMQGQHSTLFEKRKEPGLLARAAAHAEYWMSLRPFADDQAA